MLRSTRAIVASPPLPTRTTRARYLTFLTFLTAGALMSLALNACRETKTSEPPATCAKVGDSCTFAPGKLGLCIEPIDGSGKLICQSQH